MELAVQAVPRISQAEFQRVLERRMSPAAQAAPNLYRIVARHGLDPAVALAFFGHESEFGTKGVTKKFDTKNWGNLRKSFSRAIPARIIDAGERGKFAAYATWEDGLEDWCQLIVELYIQRKNLTTVDQILHVYAPTSDGNKPLAYIEAVRKLVTQWAAEDPVRSVTTRDLHFRASPSPTGTSLGVLEKGTQLRVLGNDGKWLRLEHDGKSGHVSGIYTQSLLAENHDVYWQTTVTAPGLNLREQGTADAAIVRELARGARLDVMAHARGWFRVRCDDAQEGWVNGASTAT